MAGKLYVVGTPIGNLSDMSPRGARALEEADFIAAEDTRVSLKLLNHLGIRKPLVSYHEHSSRSVSESILARISAGESCAVVTDAGMPCISDPGEDLVKLCAENGVEVVVVPGPSAVISALAVSGLATSRFSFEGFLSTAKKQRYAHLESVAEDTRTLIFYEAPHKLLSTLEDMHTYFGDRRISLCRELTKLHEEVIRTTLDQAAARYREKPPRGEFVLVVEGAPEKAEKPLSLEEALALVQALVDGGMRRTDACREVAKDSGFSKSRLYAGLE